MAVDAVFLSSVVAGFEDVRDAAADAISASGLHAIRSEELSADPASSQRALLDQVAAAEYYLLLLGAHYGDTGAGDTSPTEDEYAEAVRLGKPILVLVQEVELESRQRQFLERIRGSWDDGVFYGTFSGADELGAKVAQALARQRSAVIEDAPAAAERALALVGEDSRHGWHESATVRVAFAPLRQTTLLDPVALEDVALADDLIAALRAAGAIPQSVGMDGDVSAAGVKLASGPQQSGPEARIYTDGAIAISGSVAAEGMLGGMQIDPDRLASLLAGTGRAAQLIWDRIDTRSEVRQVAVSAAVLDAQHLAFGASSSGSVSMGGSIPDTLIAPNPPHVVPRGQLDQESPSHRVQAAIKRVFADAGRVQS
ncbi:MAG TPA: DUF4062 domain-containing protein [Solirubrobacterales bacterium]|nr:DUF4062 domain-containing protein [Solirubrobacterales bacterium]